MVSKLRGETELGLPWGQGKPEAAADAHGGSSLAAALLSGLSDGDPSCQAAQSQRTATSLLESQSSDRRGRNTRCAGKVLLAMTERVNRCEV